MRDAFRIDLVNMDEPVISTVNLERLNLEQCPSRRQVLPAFFFFARLIGITDVPPRQIPTLYVPLCTLHSANNK